MTVRGEKVWGGMGSENFAMSISCLPMLNQCKGNGYFHICPDEKLQDILLRDFILGLLSIFLNKTRIIKDFQASGWVRGG